MSLWRRIFGGKPDHDDDGIDERLKEAEQRLADLAARADRVVPELERRDRRNCWAESIDLMLREARRT